MASKNASTQNSGCSPSAAASFRRKITILSRTTTATAGGYTESPNVVLSTWGSVTVKMGSPLIAALAGQMMAQAQYIITMRYPPSIHIAPDMRVQDGAKVFRIHQVIDVDERHQTMQLQCVEEPAA